MAKITDKQRAKLAVQNMRTLTVRSWSEIEEAAAKKTLDDVVARSKADSDGLGPSPIPMALPEP